MSLFVGRLSRQLARERTKLDKKITMLGWLNTSSSSEKELISFSICTQNYFYFPLRCLGIKEKKEGN